MLSDWRCVHKASVPNSPSSGKHQLMGIECSQTVYNIHLSSYDPHPPPWEISILVQVDLYWTSTAQTFLEKFRKSVLATLPIQRAPLKFTMKQKQTNKKKKHRSPMSSTALAVHVLFLSELSNQKTTSDRQECRIFWLQQFSLHVTTLISALTSSQQAISDPGSRRRN